VEQNTSWEANSRSATQEITSLLRNRKVNYRFHEIPPLVPNLSAINPVYNFLIYFLRSILIVSSHLCLGLPSGLVLSCFPSRIFSHCAFSSSRNLRPKVSKKQVICMCLVLRFIGLNYVSNYACCLKVLVSVQVLWLRICMFWNVTVLYIKM
jgi:hypothetical protein